MNEMKIFENDEFGKVRTVVIDNEPWFVGKDVAEILGYAKPLNALASHVDSDDSLKQGVTDNLGRTQETIIINESGLYSLILSSKLQNAKKFKRWVTSEVLPQLRRTGKYEMPRTTGEQIQLLAKGYTELNERIESIDKDLQEFKDDMPLLAVECQKITKAKNLKVVSILGGKDSNAYQDRSIRGKVYSDLDSIIRREFGVETYKAIKRNQVDVAVKIIDEYKLPLHLKEIVSDCNAQYSF